MQAFCSAEGFKYLLWVLNDLSVSPPWSRCWVICWDSHAYRQTVSQCAVGASVFVSGAFLALLFSPFRNTHLYSDKVSGFLAFLRFSSMLPQVAWSGLPQADLGSYMSFSALTAALQSRPFHYYNFTNIYKIRQWSLKTMEVWPWIFLMCSIKKSKTRHLAIWLLMLLGKSMNEIGNNFGSLLFNTVGPWLIQRYQSMSEIGFSSQRGGKDVMLQCKNLGKSHEIIVYF